MSLRISVSLLLSPENSSLGTIFSCQNDNPRKNCFGEYIECLPLMMATYYDLIGENLTPKKNLTLVFARTVASSFY